MTNALPHLVMLVWYLGFIKLILDDLQPVKIGGMYMRPRRGWVR